MPQATGSRTLNIFLWIAQFLLAASFVWAASLKLFQPLFRLSTMWPWTAQVPLSLLKATGIIDLLGGLGILLPSLLRIRPGLTSVTGICIIVLMICASIFHISRGEASVIGVNVFFALLAAFIAWGRYKKVPVQSR